MPVTDAQALDSYIQAAEYQAKAKVCAQRIDHFSDRFDLLYQSWRLANAKSVERGAVLARSKNSNPSVERFAEANAQLLESLPNDDFQRRCSDVLVSLQKANSL